MGPLPGDEWGFTATFDRENGGGFLTDHFPCATKAIWYFEGIYAYSPQIPGEFDLNLFPCSFLIFTLHPSIVLSLLNRHSGIIFATYILVYMHRRSEIPRFNTPWNSWNSTINGTIEYLE